MKVLYSVKVAMCYLISLLKPDKDHNNFRTINIQNTVGKLLEKIIYLRKIFRQLGYLFNSTYHWRMSS